MQGGEKRIGEAMERTRCCIAMCESGEGRKEERRRKEKERKRKEGGGKRKRKRKKKKRRTILWIVLFEKEHLFSVFLRVCYIHKREGKCGTPLP